ncbi:MAG TPA: hypothetical protein VJ866_02105 [Pyrinomonadaceae bacterium]|nr:hypothetical protein [Pyrinomonadaceae bacterium]
MPNRPAGQAAQQGARVHAGGARRRAHTRPRMPSTAGYMFGAGGLALALFVAIWMLLRWDGAEDAPWVPAGLAAGAVILVAAAAREIVMRRAWARYTREMEMLMGAGPVAPVSLKTKSGAFARPDMQAQVAALRGLQQRLAELDAPGTSAEAHQEACKLCEQYLANAEEVLRAPGGAAEMRAALRSGQERVGALRRRHMLAWARGEATRLTQEAQRRVRPSDKIETARGALDVLEEALRAYPGERELLDSADALRNFVASVKVGQWVEMAERAAFRGKFQRAIARYRDALFYLSRAEMSEEAREDAARRIQREIEMLRARSRTAEGDDDFGGEGAGPRPAGHDAGAAGDGDVIG